MKELTLDIVTPGKDITGVAVTSVTVPGSNGEMTFLVEHTDIISSLDVGPLFYKKKEGGEEKFVVKSGFVQVEENKVSVLTESATNLKEVDRQSVEERKKNAQEKFKTLDEKLTQERGKLFNDIKESDLILKLS
ncbi:MAG: ATP synthase F1 subunit epsilon [Deltaproteobacteria bacterium]|nr:ATP synthase F1 subunit epsilon [Deltaproteobacteria bacterium]